MKRSQKLMKCPFSADGVRSLDGLHIGAARIMGCDTIATSDIRLGEAAEGVGLSAFYDR